MLIPTTSRITITLALALGAFLSVGAQTYRLPGAHTAEHRDLIAGQINVGDQIKVEDTQQFLDQLFKDEEEPEADIYTEGWESQSVNCYRNAIVPQTKDIDVKNFSMPCPGYMTSPYGYRKRFRRQHKGVDLKLNTGDTVRAAFDGKIRLTRYERNGYGYYVVMRHENGLETVYGHLSKFLVSPNQYVKAGDPIALGGNTGRSFGAHLHFETRFMGYPINPSAIFDFANQTVHTDVYTFDKDTYQQARDYSPAAHREYAQKYLQQKQKANKTANTGTKAKAKSKTMTYKVRKGDSLSKIASRNGITLKQLCRLNGLKTNSKLIPGKVLKIR